MGETPPGWYEDQDDPSLARWWDGDRWTEHTLVIADQVPNVQPPPPAGYGDAAAGTEAFLADEDDWNRLDEDDHWDERPDEDTAASVFAPIPVPTQEPAAAAPTSVFALDDEEPPTFGGSWEVEEPYPVPARRTGWADQVRDLPPWARIAVPVAVVLLLVAAVAASGALGGDDGGGDDEADGTTTTILDPVRVRSAALVAVREADLPSLTTTIFAELIPLTCEAAREDDTEELVDEIQELDFDDPTLDRLLVGLEAGAEEYCPADMSANADLIDDLYRALGVARSGTTVLATTSSSSTSSTATTATTSAPTTRPPTTRAPTTTRRPTTTAAPTTTQPPATTAPPTTAAPTTTDPPPTTTVPSSPVRSARARGTSAGGGEDGPGHGTAMVRRTRPHGPGPPPWQAVRAVSRTASMRASSSGSMSDPNRASCSSSEAT